MPQHTGEESLGLRREGQSTVRYSAHTSIGQYAQIVLDVNLQSAKVITDAVTNHSCQTRQVLFISGTMFLKPTPLPPYELPVGARS